MTNNTAAIERQLTIEAPIAKVWAAITDPKQVSQWFGETAEFEPKPQALGWFGWQQHGQFALRVEQVEAPTRFAWRWMADKDVPFNEQDSTLVEFHLTAIDNQSTLLSLRESGFKTPESRQDNVGGWAEELADLLHFLNPAN